MLEITLNTNPRTFCRRRAVSVDYFKGLDGPNIIVDGRKAVMPAMQAMPEHIQRELERVEPSARSLRTLMSEQEKRRVMADMESRPGVRSVLGRYNLHSLADIRNDFVVQNLTNYKLHKKFFPSTFSEQVRILASLWTNAVKNALLAVSDNGMTPIAFSVGFVFERESEDMALAMHEKCWEVGHIFYINPAICAGGTGERSGWGLRYPRPKSREVRNALQAMALHEVTHCQGFRSHDELFAARLTRNVEQFFDYVGRKGFRHCRDVVTSAAA